DARPDLRQGHVLQAERRGETTVVGTRLVGTGTPLKNFRGGMQRRKPFVKLRAEQSESGQPATRRQMAGAGVVANENAGLVQAAQQFSDAARAHGGLAASAPPVNLVAIA